MMFKKKGFVLAVACVLILSFLAGCSQGGQPAQEEPEEQAQQPEEIDFPTKPLELIVAFSAGGPTDVPARILAKYWEEELGQPIVVVNKPGAQGQIGHAETAQAKPDGYTLGFLNVPILNLTGKRSGIYDPSSFDYIRCNIIDVGAIMVPKGSKYTTLEELLEDAKARPGEVLLTCNGPATDDYLGLLEMQDAAGVEFGYVPQTDDAGTITAIMGGHADVGLANLSNYVAHQADVVVLALLSDERSVKFPDIPTFEEITGKKATYASARGLGAPKGLPDEVLAKLRETFAKAAQNPDLIADFDQIGFDEIYWTGEEFEAYTVELENSIDKWEEKLGLDS